MAHSGTYYRVLTRDRGGREPADLRFPQHSPKTRGARLFRRRASRAPEKSRQEGWTTVWHDHARPGAAVAAENRATGGAVKRIRRVLPALVLCSGLVLAVVPAVPALAKMLFDPDFNDRLAAAAALESLGAYAEAAVPALARSPPA